MASRIRALCLGRGFLCVGSDRGSVLGRTTLCNQCDFFVNPFPPLTRFASLPPCPLGIQTLTRGTTAHGTASVRRTSCCTCTTLLHTTSCERVPSGMGGSGAPARVYVDSEPIFSCRRRLRARTLLTSFSHVRGLTSVTAANRTHGHYQTAALCIV